MTLQEPRIAAAAALFSLLRHCPKHSSASFATAPNNNSASFATAQTKTKKQQHQRRCPACCAIARRPTRKTIGQEQFCLHKRCIPGILRRWRVRRTKMGRCPAPAAFPPPSRFRHAPRGKHRSRNVRVVRSTSRASRNECSDVAPGKHAVQERDGPAPARRLEAPPPKAAALLTPLCRVKRKWSCPGST